MASDDQAVAGHLPGVKLNGDLESEASEPQGKSPEQRIEELEDTVESLRSHVWNLEEILIGDLGVPKAEIIVSDHKDVLGWLEELEQQDGGGGSQGLDRDKLLPVHNMWLDLQNGNADALPNASARRGARLFGRLWNRAGGEADTAVSVTRSHYVIESSDAAAVLREAGDMTDGGVSKTVSRAMRTVQRHSKVEDCDCENIEVCDHGLIQYDASGGTNQLRAVKKKFNAYGYNVEAAFRDSDDLSEQLGEDLDDTKDGTPGQATQSSNGQSDTVVRLSEGSASDQPQTTPSPQS